MTSSTEITIVIIIIIIVFIAFIIIIIIIYYTCTFLFAGYDCSLSIWLKTEA